MILAACFGAGTMVSQVKKQRIETLRGLCAALELMEAELGTRLSPMPELVGLLAGKMGGQTGAFFSHLSSLMEKLGAEDFSALWQEAANAMLDALDAADLDELCRLGHILGQYELDKQLAAVRLCAAALRSGLDAAEKEYPGEKRLGLGLSTAAGALLIIALF